MISFVICHDKEAEGGGGGKNANVMLHEMNEDFLWPELIEDEV